MSKQSIPQEVQIQPSYRHGMIIEGHDGKYGRIVRVDADIRWDDSGKPNTRIRYLIQSGGINSSTAEWFYYQDQILRVLAEPT